MCRGAQAHPISQLNHTNFSFIRQSTFVEEGTYVHFLNTIEIVSSYSWHGFFNILALSSQILVVLK